MPAGRKGKKKAGGAKGKEDGGGGPGVPDPPDVQFRKMYKSFKTRSKGLADPDGAAPIARLLKAISDGAEEKDFVWPQRFVVTEPVSAEAVDAVCEALRECPYDQLRSLSFWNADIGDAGAASVARLVRHLPSLTKVEMLDCQVGVRGCKVLGDELARSAAHHLQVLRLDHNGFGTAGLEGLLAGLRHAPGLRTLSVSYCDIGPDGGEVLADMLASKRVDLRMLSVEGNRLGSVGVAALGRGLAGAAAKNMTCLNAALCNLGPEADAVAALGDGIAAHTELVSANLDGNLIGDAAAVALANRLHDSKVTELRVTASLGRAAFLYVHEVIASHKPPPAKKKGKGKGKGKKKK